MPTSTTQGNPQSRGNPNLTLERKLRSLYFKIKAAREFYEKNRILYYRPHDKQQDFHAKDTSTGRVVFGGNRSGKTTCGAIESYAHLVGYRPWLPEGHPNRLVRLADGSPIPVPNIGRIVCEDFETTMTQVIWPKIEDWFPADVLANSTIKRNPRGVPTMLQLPKSLGGSKVFFMSYDQKIQKFEGHAFHWLWGDEPMPQPIFTGLRRGLIDFNGHYWLTMTPISEPWINTVLMSRANVKDSGIYGFIFDMEDNCREHGSGVLPHSAIEAALADMPPDEREARKTGQPLHLVGRVFKDWVAEPPYWIEPFRIPREWPRVCVIDPHPRKPVAVTWMAISPDDIVYVYRDLYDYSLYTVREVVEEMRRLEGWEEVDASYRAGQAAPRTTWRFGKYSEEVCLYIIDTSANEHERTSGKTIKQEFAEHGVHCIEARKKNKNAGINAIKDALRVRNQWHEPGLIVFNTCANVKQNFENYIWPRDVGVRRANEAAEKQEPLKKNDDHIDGIRYLFQMRLDYSTLHVAVQSMRAYTERQRPSEPRLGQRLDLHPDLNQHTNRRRRRGRCQESHTRRKYYPTA